MIKIKLPTSLLIAGDVVLAEGMRIRIDAVRERLSLAGPGATWWCPGTVLNAADVIAKGIMPAEFLERWQPGQQLPTRRDWWVVQGTDQTRWNVERII